MLTEDKISFKRIQMEDLKLIHRWLNKSHVHAWYEKVGFKYTKTIQLPKEPNPSYIMELKKEDLTS